MNNAEEFAFLLCENRTFGKFKFPINFKSKKRIDIQIQKPISVE